MQQNDFEQEIKLIFKKTLNEQNKNPFRVLNMEKINFLRKIDNPFLKTRLNQRFEYFLKSIKKN